MYLNITFLRHVMMPHHWLVPEEGNTQPNYYRDILFELELFKDDI
jgi:hypothetical protein